MSSSEATPPYSQIAPFYDAILRHVDYQEWYEYIKTLMLNSVRHVDLIVELGCGTGRFGAKFSNDYFNIFGVDLSLDMLRVAKTRAYAGFRVFCADMTCFTLKQKPDFIFSVHDTMNYFLEMDDIRRVLRCVRRSMHGRSVFLFDLTTEYNILKNFDGKTTKFSFRNQSVEWGNRYEKKKHLVMSTLKLYQRGCEKFIETHVQRIYPIEEITSVLEEEKFEILGIYGDYSYLYPTKNAVMINFLVRKKGR